ncbi:MAG: D-aminoacyl-tRNA deacylase [Chloroflexota bacterium]|nr:D-aminoacyl-tRNA deacylase [Chloroflexota bacterium]
MRALLQRVSSASLTVDGRFTGSIGVGFVVLLGITEADTLDDASYLVEKTVNLRVFADGDGRFNRSLDDVGGSLMVVSQFTLYADTRKGRRPSFIHAARPEVAEPLYEQSVSLFREACSDIVTGVFGGYMQVEIHNDGPVTIMLDSADRHTPRRQA